MSTQGISIATSSVTRSFFWGDAAVLFLATLNIHLVIARHWGVSIGRRWALTLLGVGAVAAGLGSATGLPFGSFRYTANAGPTFFDWFPLAVPFLCYVIVSTGLMLSRLAMPWVSAKQEAMAVATGVTLFDFILEPYAVWSRHYWYWGSLTVPIQNYISWWAITYLVVRLAAPTMGMRSEREWRPQVILGGLLAVLIVGRIVTGV